MAEVTSLTLARRARLRREEERWGTNRDGQDEMRPITALFADIVGSTGLGERLGPDEVKALIGECVTRMSRAVEDFGGVIQAFMGDGICAYFGVPAAHEDDPERAARAALRILGVAAGYAGEVEAAWGIEGFNVAWASTADRPRWVWWVGRVPDRRAGRYHERGSEAPERRPAGLDRDRPGTASRLDERFVLEPLGEVTVKGGPNPSSASRLVGPRPVPSRRRAHPGRARARARAAGTAVADLRAGRGQVVLVVGDAGWARRGCSPSSSRSPERTSPGSRAGASPTGRARRTVPSSSSCGPGSGSRRRMPSSPSAPSSSAGRRAPGAAQDRTLPYLGLMLSIRLEPDVERELLALSADELSDRAGRSRAGGARATRPLVLAIDDLHWADRTTRELAERLLALTDRSAVMLAAALRPDPGSEGWSSGWSADAVRAPRGGAVARAARGRGVPS